MASAKRKDRQHSETLYATFTQEFTNIIGLLHHIEDILRNSPTKVYLFRKNHQHSKTLYVTFTEEFTNIIGLLHHVEAILTQKISSVNMDKD
ncbi:hypothetical protein C4D60_Mb11t06320 [Musa balbisiana]|uniref:Uncharacterized protein n=1 Tax=Musa balbisiana TaxID=52838 RepID=A0A4S8J252_MUSBA|nr:hypothetical protein C4D60_Mb11t06320 [Musa balbisiana]